MTETTSASRIEARNALLIAAIAVLGFIAGGLAASIVWLVA